MNEHPLPGLSGNDHPPQEAVLIRDCAECERQRHVFAVGCVHPGTTTVFVKRIRDPVGVEDRNRLTAFVIGNCEFLVGGGRVRGHTRSEGGAPGKKVASRSAIGRLASHRDVLHADPFAYRT